MKELKVVHLNTSGIGGAAIACHRLHHLMLSAGINSKIIHLYDNCQHEKEFSFLKYSWGRRFTNHILYELVQKDLKPDAYVFSETAPLPSNIAKNPLIKDADVIYLHWVLGGFLSKKDFEEIAQLGKPVFCFTHDMWWITGGCHYSFDCNEYKTGCKRCHLHKHLSQLTRMQSNWKKKIYHNYPNIRFISPSNWLKKCAEESFVMEQGRCFFVPNVVPETTFKYLSKTTAREQLDLPQDKIIISFGTADNTNKVKGFTYLQHALKGIHDNRILLCVYGCDYDQTLAMQIDLPIKFLGKLNANEVATANAAADLFISPTLAESVGQTLLENIKCGTPVISTNATAVPEIVKDKVNGYLVEPKNSGQIADAINKFLKDPIVLDGSSDEIFSEQSILNNHIRLINDALKETT